MDLKDLIARGALVSTPPTPREITWTPRDPFTKELTINEETGEPWGECRLTIYIRAPSCGWQDRMRMAAARAGEDRISYEAAVISHAIVFGKDQAQCFTYDEAYILAEGLRAAMMAAFNEVHTPPPRPAPDADKQEDFSKNTEPMPGSGTNSSNPASAAEASQPLASH
jgi:hypothetical protein